MTTHLCGWNTTDPTVTLHYMLLSSRDHFFISGQGPIFTCRREEQHSHAPQQRQDALRSSPASDAAVPLSTPLLQMLLYCIPPSTLIIPQSALIETFVLKVPNGLRDALLPTCSFPKIITLGASLTNVLQHRWYQRAPPQTPSVCVLFRERVDKVNASTIQEVGEAEHL